MRDRIAEHYRYARGYRRGSGGSVQALQVSNQYAEVIYMGRKRSLTISELCLILDVVIHFSIHSSAGSLNASRKSVRAASVHAAEAVLFGERSSRCSKWAEAQDKARGFR